jgi:hypothetical protein
MALTLLIVFAAGLVYVASCLVLAPSLSVSRETLTPVDPSWPPPSGPMVMEDDYLDTWYFKEFITAWLTHSDHWLREDYVT